MIPPRPVFRYRSDGRIDYPAMRNAATRVLSASLQAQADVERAAAAARVAAAIRSQVQAGFRPSPGRLWSVDAGARMLIGPAGGIGLSLTAARTLEAMAAPGRHDEGAVAAAAGWRDVADLREAIQSLAPKLAAIGLRVDRRRTGVRITKLRTLIEKKRSA